MNRVMKSLGHKSIVAATLFLLLLIVSACGAANEPSGGNEAAQPSAQQDQAKEAPKPAETAPVKREPAELIFHCSCGWSQDIFNARFGDKMRSKFPEYTINYIQKQGSVTNEAFIENLIVSGTKIDVFFESIMTQFSHLETFQLQRDMSDLIKKHNVDLGRIEPATMATIRKLSDGKIYALPLVINTGMMYYNKTIFDKFAVPYPKNGMYWDEVIDLGKRLNQMDGGHMYYGIGGAFEHIVSISPLRVSYLDEKTGQPTIQKDANWKPIYEMITGIRRTTNNLAGAPEQGMQSVSGVNSFVKDQRLGMYMFLVNTFLNEETSAMNWWDMASYPYHREAPGVGQQPFATVFSVTSQSRYPDQAMEVLAGMLSDEVQLGLAEIGTLPAIQSADIQKAFGTKSAYANKNIAAVFHNKMVENRHITKYDSKALGIYQHAANVQNPLAAGTLDVNTASRQIEEETLKMLEQEKAR